MALEEPTYHNVFAALAGLGLHPTPVPMGEGGIDLAALERALARPEVRLVYTIPTFHNPMGITHLAGAPPRAARDRRRAGQARARGRLPDGPRGPRQALRPRSPRSTRRGWWCNFSSFSKTLFPGVRIGAILARGRHVQGLLALKRASDLSDAMPLQAALAELVGSGAYDRHLTVAARASWRGRRKALARHAAGPRCRPAPRWTRARGRLPVLGRAARRPRHGGTCSRRATRGARAALTPPATSSCATAGAPMRCASRWRMADEAAAARGVGAAGRARARAAGPRRRASRGAAVHVEEPLMSDNGNGQGPRHGAVLRDQGGAGRDAEGRRHHGRDQAEQANIAEDAGAAAVMAWNAFPPTSARKAASRAWPDRGDRGHPANGLDPGDGEGRIGHFQEARCWRRSASISSTRARC